MDSDWKWLLPFVVLDLFRLIFFGAHSTVFGPSQPYLAKKVNIPLEDVGWLWTVVGASGLVTSVLASLTFKQYITSAKWKLLVIIGTLSLGGLPGLFIPTVESFSTLVLLIVIERMATNYGETGAAGISLYTLGPVKSRWVIMARNAFVGIGFLFGPFLVHAYFPEERNRDTTDLCQPDKGQTSHSLDSFSDEELSKVLTPFQILSVLIIVSALMNSVNFFLPYEMPVYGIYEQELRDQTLAKNDMREPVDYFIALLMVAFYFGSCGSERLFQSMQFIFGLCGPLQLSPDEAVIIDKCYNGGFMTGRIISIFFVQFMTPKAMLKVSLLLCFVVGLTITYIGPYSANFLFLSVLMFGFAVSWQYGSMFSYCSEHMDLVGIRAAFPPVGCAIGSMFIPPVAGHLFHRVGPVSIWYLNLLCVIIQILSAVVLFSILKNKVQEAKQKGFHYKNIPQRESDEETKLE